MNRKFFFPIVAALVLAAAFLSCNKDNGNNDGNNVKLLHFELDHYGNNTRYEYDTQNRITKITGYSSNGGTTPYRTQTLMYGGNNLIKFDDYTLTAHSANQLTYSDGRSTHTFELNSDSTLAKVLSSYANGWISEINYQYQNGNLTKKTDELLNGESHRVSTSEYTYDNMHSPFLNCKTPKWWMIWQISGSKNNATELVVYENGEVFKLIFSYEYDNEGYPARSFFGELRTYYSYDKWPGRKI